MTLEERANQLYFELSVILPPLPQEWSAIAVSEACTAMIRDSIYSAVEAEREACVQIAINHARLCEQRRQSPEWADKAESLLGGEISAAKIVVAIEARSKDTP